MVIFDLHMHSNFSRDGEFTPKQLIQMCHEKGLKYVALSDHNDYKGIDEMIEEGKKLNITVFPAIEFDTLFENLEVHLLGYNFDYHDPYFKDLASRIDHSIDSALSKRIELFRKNYGVEIDEKEVYEKTLPKENPFYTLCDLMLNDPKNSHISDFKDYIKGGKRSSPQAVNFYWDKCSAGTKNYVKIDFPDFKKTVAKIHELGGICILAHPWKNFYQNEALLLKAIEAGIDGIEAYSNYHEEKHNLYYEDFCQKHNLIMTCGSDFHGKTKPNIKLGEYGYNKDDGQQLINKFMNKLLPR